MLSRLDHRGPDGQDILAEDSLALGHQHLWTIPEEVGDRQPLRLPGFPYIIAFDGRLDNRSELFAEIPGSLHHPQNELSDAALVILAYAHWGKRCFEHLIGEFALALWDGQQNELVLARDPLGDRTLFYALDEHRLAAASEPWAVLGCPGLSAALDETALANYYCARFPTNEHTLFAAVKELLPAQALSITLNQPGQKSQVHSRIYWQPDPGKQIRFHSDKEYAACFLDLLEEAVRCRLRSTLPLGILMSGGLDSGSLGCLAARQLSPQPLTAFSYVFDELPTCDERAYIQPIIEQYSMKSVYVTADDAWPLRDWPNWPACFNWPEGNVYRLVKEKTYQRIQQEGLRVVLTGTCGDNLYAGSEDWLADLLAERRLAEAWHSLKMHWRAWGTAPLLHSPPIHRLLARLPGARLLPKHTDPPPSWLTPHAARLVAQEHRSEIPHLPPRLANRSGLFGLFNAQDVSGEIVNANRYSFELRDPFHDRRLVEYVLAVPAYQLYHEGITKYILRNAMAGILPEMVRKRRDRSNFTPFYVQGFEREWDHVPAWVESESALWRNFVKPGWYSEDQRQIVCNSEDSLAKLLPWLCISAESWWQKLSHIV